MATPVAEQALLLAQQMGIENPSAEVIETYTDSVQNVVSGAAGANAICGAR